MENSLNSNSRTKDYGKNKIIAASLFTLETAKSPGAIYGPFSDKIYISITVQRKLLNSVHTELLAITLALAMQNWGENFAKEWVKYRFLAMPANANSIANVQREWILRPCSHLVQIFVYVTIDAIVDAIEDANVVLEGLQILREPYCKTTGLIIFVSGQAIDKYYLPVIVPIGVTGNVLSFLVSGQILVNRQISGKWTDFWKMNTFLVSGHILVSGYILVSG